MGWILGRNAEAQAEADKKKAYKDVLRKEVGNDVDYYSEKAINRRIYNKTAAQEKLRLQKKFARQQTRKQFQKSKSINLRQKISSQVRAIQRQVNAQQNTLPPARTTYKPPYQEESFNPWEHRDPAEVYGSDELTFFDSQHQRSKRRTGSLFGI